MSARLSMAAKGGGSGKKDKKKGGPANPPSERDSITHFINVRLQVSSKKESTFKGGGGPERWVLKLTQVHKKGKVYRT